MMISMLRTQIKWPVYFFITLFFLGCKDDEETGLKIKYFDLEKNELKFDVAGAIELINIKTNLSGIKIEVSQPWVEAKLISEKQLEVKVAQSPDEVDERSAEITLLSEYNIKKVIQIHQSALSDVKIKPLNASAAFSHSANAIGLSLDNNYNTYYMSHWTNTKFPFDVIYDFEDVSRIDFIRYHPRPGGEKKNGLLSKLEIWCLSGNHTSFVKYGDFDFAYKAEIQEVKFSPALVQPRQIKFVIYQGYGTGTYAAIGEMEFFKAGKNK